MSMTQFNLLPDVKMSYIKAKRTKRLVVLVSFIVTGVSIAIFLFMMSTVYIVQKKQLSNADKSIASATSQLQSTPNLNKILTIQNQLNTISSLHKSKHINSRLFTYLPQIVPTNVSLNRLTLDNTKNTMQLSGTTDSLASVNVFIDTLKFTTYKLKDTDKGKNAFTVVTETSFGLDKNGASFTLTITYDPTLFVNGPAPTLTVVSQTTTRSVLNDPGTLFTGTPGGSQNTTTTGGTQ